MNDPIQERLLEDAYDFGWSRTRIKIPKVWHVLDVGSGHNPHPRADVCLDNIDVPESRHGRDVVKDARFVEGDVLDMPFQDKEFDFVIALHLAEHVSDPAQFCEELMRVGRSGYIETPSPVCEWMLAEPVHLWLVGREADRLVFYEKPPGFRPFSSSFYELYYQSPFSSVLQHDLVMGASITYTRLLWMGRFDYDIRGFAYESLHAGWDNYIGEEGSGDLS